MRVKPRYRVLVVEDDELMMAAMEAVLKPAYEVEFVRTAAHAMARAKERSKPKIDCAVIDPGLPNSAGLSLVKRFQKSLPDIATVVMTGQSDITASDAILAGAQGFISKGYEIGEQVICDVIDQAVSRHTVRQSFTPVIQEVIDENVEHCSSMGLPRPTVKDMGTKEM